MRIAQLTYSYRPITGGADAYAELLRRTLRERGHEVWVYQRAMSVQGEVITEDPFVRCAPQWQSRLRPRDFWLVPYWLLAQRHQLAELDVLIAHYPNYCRPAYFHPRLVGLSHGVTWDDSPGTWRSRRKRKMAQEAFERCWRFVANDTFFLREVGLDIAPGTHAFEEVATGRWYIPNSVDTTIFVPSEDEREPVIVVPRNLYRNRGVHLAVQALAVISAEFPEYQLKIVGAESQPEYAAEVRQLVRQLELSGRVRFAGSVPWAEMASVYARSRVCVIPSLCGEGTSLAALEAMACGTATVTTNAGGLTDLPGVQCAPDAESLASALRNVLPRWREVGESQCAAVRANFSLPKWQEAWAHVVEDW